MPRIPATDRVPVNNRVAVLNRIELPETQQLLVYNTELTAEVVYYTYEATLERVTDILNPSTRENGVTRITDNIEENYHGMGQGLHLTGTRFNTLLRNTPVVLWATVKAETMKLVALDMLLLWGDTWALFDLENEEVLEVISGEDPGIAKNLSAGMEKLEDGWFLIWMTCDVNNSDYEYPMDYLGMYILGSGGAMGDARSIFYEGDEKSFLVADWGLAINNHPLPFIKTEGAIFDEGNLRLKII
jgi:hypothetical protein